MVSYHQLLDFLSLITFLEMGVGAVIQSSLYEPLAKKINWKLVKL